MTKNPIIFLEHIIESIDLIEQYTRSYKEKDFLISIKLQDLVARRLEIIGEAVKNISKDIKIQYPEVEWKKIAGMRDYLIHAYFGIDLKLTWKVVEKDIPILKKQVNDILCDLKLEYKY